MKWNLWCLKWIESSVGTWRTVWLSLWEHRLNLLWQIYRRPPLCWGPGIGTTGAASPSWGFQPSEPRRILRDELSLIRWRGKEKRKRKEMGKDTNFEMRAVPRKCVCVRERERWGERDRDRVRETEREREGEEVSGYLRPVLRLSYAMPLSFVCIL